MGSSKPWEEVMRNMTGQPKMSAQPILEYFAPLIKWLNNELACKYSLFTAVPLQYH